MDKVKEALAEWELRQAREKHPDGKFDNGGRWYPSEQEEQACCKGIRSPSRSYPYSLLHHCRSKRHVALLFGVKPAELYQAARTQEREGGDDYYKVVALTEDGRMLSVYDGQTEYRIGETVKDTPRQNHGGGLYVYTSPEAAEGAAFPLASVLRDAEKVLIRVRAEGSYCRYLGAIHWIASTNTLVRTDKLAFSRVTPLEVVKKLEGRKGW